MKNLALTFPYILGLSGCLQSEDTMSKIFIEQYRNSANHLRNADVSLENCLLTVKYEKPGRLRTGVPDQSQAPEILETYYFRANIAMYQDLRQFRGGPLSGRHFARIDRKPASKQMLAEAYELVDHAPAALLRKAMSSAVTRNRRVANKARPNSGTQSWMGSRDKAKFLIDQRSLKFSLRPTTGRNQVQVPTYQPNKDGPEFYKLATFVESGNDVTNAYAKVVYWGKQRTADRVYSGVVGIQPSFDLFAPNERALFQLVRALRRYREVACPQDQRQTETLVN
ncbi:MAG: hypothetical protein AAF299_17070 [Pseudomonadota bacterium]